MSKARRRATTSALALLTAVGTWACGSSETPEGPPAAGIAELAQAPAPPANRAPVLRSVSIHPWEPVAGELISAVADAADPDGDAVRLTYQWVVDGRRYESGENDTLVLPERSKGAVVELEVIPSDGRLDGAASLTRVRVGNRPPAVVDLLLEPGLEITVEDELAASARVDDPDRDPVEVRYRWFVNDRAVGAQQSTLGRRYFRRGDRIQLEAVASDGDDESEPLRSPEIKVLNSPPRIVSTPEKIDEDGSFRYAVAVEDADDDRRLRYRLLQGPPGMTLDWLSGKLAWTPSDDQEGTHPVEIEVDDLAGGRVTQTFEIQVGFEEAEQAPEKESAQAAAGEAAEEPEQAPAALQP